MNRTKKYSEWVLNEGSLSSVTINEVINREFINRVLLNSYNKELLVHQYMHEENIDNEEDVDYSDFLEWVKYELKYIAENFIENLNKNIIKNGKIRVWRAMKVKNDWESKLPNEAKHLGIYWTWDKDCAETHWGYNQDLPFTAVMEAEIDEKLVDWYPTIRLNTEPISYEEKEIRLVKGSPIKMTSIWIDGNQIDISNINDKKFIA